MKAIYKREVSSYFNSMIGWIFVAVLTVFIGIYFFAYNLFQGYPYFSLSLGSSLFIFMVVVPILTMRSMADERHTKTDQLLLTAPVSVTAVVLGKYFAMLTVFAVPVAIACLCPLIIAANGTGQLASDYASILAFFLLGAALIAVGVFLSSLTDNQGLAAGLGIAVILLNYYSVSLSEYVSSTPVGALAALLVLILAVGAVVRYLTRNSNLAYGVCLVLLAAVAALYFVDSTAFEGLLPTVMSALSLFERFYTFVNGVFDLTAVFYYLTVAALFLFLSVQSLEKRRYN